VVDPQIVCSLNMPYIDNHAYGLLLERNLGELDPGNNPELAAALEGRPLLECFVQPGGREPNAENIHNARRHAAKSARRPRLLCSRRPPTSTGPATSTG
jgi:hypothetical protein